MEFMGNFNPENNDIISYLTLEQLEVVSANRRELMEDAQKHVVSKICSTQNIAT